MGQQTMKDLATPRITPGGLRRNSDTFVRALVIAVAVIATSSCISIEYEESGITEHSQIDYEALGREIFEKAKKQSAEFDERAEILPLGHKLVVNLKDVLDELLEYHTPDVATIGGGFFDKYEKFEYFHEKNVRLTVLVRDAPLALAYPNGRVYVTAGLIDPSLSFGARNRAQVVGVMAHELVHLWDGHVLHQWVTVESRKRELFKKAAAGLTSILPIVSYTYEPGATYEHAAEFNQMIEFNADRIAVKILEDLGYRPTEYLDLLRRLKRYKDERNTSAREPFGWIDGRITCLDIFFHPRKVAMKIVLTKPEQDQATRHVDLEGEHQYGLCLLAQIYLSPHGRDTISNWLESPDGQDFDEVIQGLPKPDLERIAQYVQSNFWSYMF